MPKPPLRHRPRRNQPGWCGWCNKRRYPREQEALGAIAAYIESGKAAEHPRAGEPLEPYRCRHGPSGGWHFGHAGDTGRKRRRA